MSEVQFDEKPTHEQMTKIPSLWFNEYLNSLKIVYPDIYTQDHWCDYEQKWTNDTNSTSVIRRHYEFLGWL